MQAAAPGLLRFLTCGSVDDGKSTLIGRLLYDTRHVLDDQLGQLEKDSRKFGTTGDSIDLALLVDGLQAEREQGITIDVAFRYFSTPRRSFIVADTPGHEQYTRNMATGASVCDMAVLLVDARKGLLTQTRRHSCIVHLLGIRHVVLAVNKMDLVGHSEAAFREIADAYRAFAQTLGIADVTCIPLSAVTGENVARRGSEMAWHDGPTLLEHLETVDVASTEADKPLRFTVQWVNRPNLDFRGFSGYVAAGRVAPGDDVVALPSGRPSKVKRIVTADGDLPVAEAGASVTLTLADEIDVSRGDMLVHPAERPEVADQAAAHIIWMSKDKLLPGRPYLMKCGAQWTTASVTQLRYKLNVDNLDHMAGRELALNDVGYCNLSFAKPIAFDSYAENRHTGAFILVDRMSNETVAAGMLQFGLRRAANIHWQALDVNRKLRSEIKHQKACCLWFTGLSGSGKSTIANLLEKRLHASGRHTYILDGDNIRHGLNRDLGFADADRVENIRRVAEVARLMVDAGLIVIVSFISPFRAERQLARDLFEPGEFLEVFVDTPLEVCEARDPKGLYKKARAGQIQNFTGISSAYEPPVAPEIHLETVRHEAAALAEELVDELGRRHLI